MNDKKKYKIKRKLYQLPYNRLMYQVLDLNVSEHVKLGKPAKASKCKHFPMQVHMHTYACSYYDV